MTIDTSETIEPRVQIEGAEHYPIYLTEDLARGIRDHAWTKLESELIGANGAYNNMHQEPFERAAELRGALQGALGYAEVVFALTPLPDESEGKESGAA